MLEIDIIIPPPFLIFKKLQYLKFPLYRRNLKWFPIWFFNRELNKWGIKVRFINIYNLNINKINKIVGIDNDICYIISNIEKFLKKIRKKAKSIIWFDFTDSASFLLYKVLPYIDLYLKRQKLKDSSLYRKNYYENRVYSDFYFRNYILEKKSNFRKSDSLDYPKNDNFNINNLKDKIDISWNLAFYNYNNSLFIEYENYFDMIKQYFSLFIKKMNIKYQKPGYYRNLLFSANFNYKSYRYFAYFQRIKLVELLSKKYKNFSEVSIGIVSKKQYRENLKNSKAIFSPFGMGEICFRDFEAFISGATLIKPKIDHIDSWPKLFHKNNTYLPLSWEIEKWDSEITDILSDNGRMLDIAKNGQKEYKKIWSSDMIDEFCSRFYSFFNF